MNMPFTAEQFLQNFEHYNHAIWPAQIIAYLVGLAAVALAFRPVPRSGRWIAEVLALLWTETRVPRLALVIPFLWSLLGARAALSYGIREDLGLLVTGPLATAPLAWRDRGPSRSGGVPDTGTAHDPHAARQM